MNTNPAIAPTVSIDWPSRAKAAGIHLGASLFVAALSALLVFNFWFPWPHRIVSGGTELFALLVGVDVVIGPLATLVVFDRRKRRAELQRDLAIVVLLQLAALAYGVHTTYLARPVVLALEGDRFRAVTAVDVLESELPQAPSGLRTLPLDGPRTVATVQPPDGNEKFEAMAMGMAGVDLGMRPRYWREWDDTARRAALAKAKPVGPLLARQPLVDDALKAALAATGRPVDELVYLPMLARRTDWVVLLAADSGEIVGFAPMDGF